MSEEPFESVTSEIEDALTNQIQALHALINVLERKGFVGKKETD